MSRRGFCEDARTISETSPCHVDHADQSESNTGSSNTSLRQGHQGSCGSGMQSEGTNKSQDQHIRTSSGSSVKVCPNRGESDEDPVSAEEKRCIYSITVPASGNQKKGFGQNQPDTGNDVPSTSKVGVVDYNNTASGGEVNESVSEQVGAQAGTPHLATLRTDFGAVDVRGNREKDDIVEPSRNDTSVPHEQIYGTKGSKDTEKEEQHDSLPVINADNSVEDPHSEYEREQPPPVPMRRDAEPVAKQTEKLADAAEGEESETISLEPQELRDEPMVTGVPLAVAVAPQMSEENRLSGGSEVSSWSILHHLNNGIQRSTVLPHHFRCDYYRSYLTLDSLTESDSDTTWRDSGLLRRLCSVLQTPQYRLMTMTMDVDKLEKRIANPTDGCRADHLPTPGKEVPDSKNKSLNSYGANLSNADLHHMFVQRNIQPPEGDVLQPAAIHAFPAQLNVQQQQEENGDRQEVNFNVPNLFAGRGQNDRVEVEPDVTEICLICREVVGEHECPLAQDLTRAFVDDGMEMERRAFNDNPAV